MRFLIVSKYGTWIEESEIGDFEEIAGKIYNNHTGYDDIIAIIKIEED